MKILVAGASGFIGSYLTGFMLKRGSPRDRRGPVSAEAGDFRPEVSLYRGGHDAPGAVAGVAGRCRGRDQPRRPLDLRPLESDREIRDPGEPHPDHAPCGPGAAFRKTHGFDQRLRGRALWKSGRRGADGRGFRRRRFSGPAFSGLGSGRRWRPRRKGLAWC